VRDAFFFDGPAGQLFCTGYLHPEDIKKRRFFLLLAPFGEEMNKSRHILAAIARSLGDAGHDVLLPDLYGSGDSAGDFGDADIETWRHDIDRLVNAFAKGREVTLIGLRFGALLAADAASRLGIRRLTLIHPVAQGQQQFNQLLRLRLASGLMGQKASETASDLRGRLDSGETLEIAGYAISPSMTQGMQALSLSNLTFASPPAIDWIELVVERDRPIMPASQRVIDAWAKQGVAVSTSTLVCDTFWATQEIAQCPAVVERVQQVLLDKAHA
jgi:exosortase A-associated hydrolase 2